MLGRAKFLLCVSIVFFLFPVVLSLIPLGSRLSVEENNLWVSSNGDFAIGFFNRSVQPIRYSVGIRFNCKSIPAWKQTVVWVAGADVTVGNKSFFKFSPNGELILVDSLNGLTVWTSKTSQLDVVSAVLGDDGNLQLLNEKQVVVWKSFDTPSDTLLPGQYLPVHSTLRAASKNSVSSYYSLYMNASGLLQLRWESDVIYWTSGTSSRPGVNAVLTSSGALQLVDKNSKSVWSAFGEDHNDTVNFRFLRLDVDGNLRIYSWMQESESWRSVWQAVENQCNVFATCGEHGVCVFNASGNPECTCPFKATSDSQNCGSSASMDMYNHTFLYGVYPPNDRVIHTSLQQCKNFCMRDSSCTAASFRNDRRTPECWIKTSQFFSGYSDLSLSAVSFVKKCSDKSDPFAVDPNSSSAQTPVAKTYKLCIPCITGAVSGTFVLFVMVQLGIVCFVYRSRKLIQKKVALACRGSNSNGGLMILSFTEINDITGNFKHQIGPKMYRGVLPNQQPVAVKDLETDIGERKFRASVSKIGSIHHKNLVKLDGYCCELDHRFLVYEYVKNGSVEKYLEDDVSSEKLTWRRRVEICLCVARAVCYLHTGCREFVSHGNLKWGNVVLDKNLEAKVSEYGLDMVDAKGSIGGEKDVEDFGKMLLTLVTGCQEIEDVCEWTYKQWMQGQPETVVDKRVANDVDLVELERVLRVAFWCLQSDERMRPSIGEVVKVLEGTLTVDPPPPPFVRRRLSTNEEPSEPSLESCQTEP